MAINKIRNMNRALNVETLTQSNRGGETYCVSGSLASDVMTLVGRKWIALSGAYSGSNLSGFTHSNGVLTCNETQGKYYFVVGNLSCNSATKAHLRLAIAKNGAILSGSEGSQFLTGSGASLEKTQIRTMSRVSLANGDTVGLQVINDTSALNLTASTIQLVVSQ